MCWRSHHRFPFTLRWPRSRRGCLWFNEGTLSLKVPISGVLVASGILAPASRRGSESGVGLL